MNRRMRKEEAVRETEKIRPTRRSPTASSRPHRVACLVVVGVIVAAALIVLAASDFAFSSFHALLAESGGDVVLAAVAPESDEATVHASSFSSLTQVKSGERLGSVHSVAELRRFCEKQSPALQKASWVKKRLKETGQRGRGGGDLPSYPIISAPVCIAENGDVFVDAKKYDRDISVFDRYVNYPLYRLTDANFKVSDKTSGTTAVPAMGLLFKGWWVSSHIGLLLRDCMAALLSVMLTFHNKELLRVPTQAVLLHEAGVDWIHRQNDVKRLSEISQRLLNSFSSPNVGGPFFPLTPEFLVTDARGVGVNKTVGPAVPPQLQPLSQCYCQAMAIERWEGKLKESQALYEALQDLTATQFPEDDNYQVGGSLSAIEARRLASHPWASQYWKEPATDAEGRYRPRALMLDRRHRRVGYWHKVKAQLVELGFRVVDVKQESLSLDKQFHLARYADMLLGMHSDGMVTALWLDRFPAGCRTVVEFRPWVHKALARHFEGMVGEYLGLDYHAMEPFNVIVRRHGGHAEEAKKELKKAHAFPEEVYNMPTYRHQTPYYGLIRSFKMFRNIRERMDACLPLSENVTRTSEVLFRP